MYAACPEHGENVACPRVPRRRLLWISAGKAGLPCAFDLMNDVTGIKLGASELTALTWVLRAKAVPSKSIDHGRHTKSRQGIWG